MPGFNLTAPIFNMTVKLLSRQAAQVQLNVCSIILVVHPREKNEVELRKIR